MPDGVLVVGAGIAGFGLARALALRGVPHTVVERLATPPAAGLGLNLPANAVRALDALGVAEDVVRAGVPVRRREYRNQSGRVLFAVDEAQFWGDVGPSVCVRRTRLLDILRAATAPSSVRWDTTVSQVEITAHTVWVQIGSGSPEEHAYVVGADGVHSAIRPAVADVHGLRPSAMTAASWRFVVPNPGVDCWTAWSGSGGTMLLIPVMEVHADRWSRSRITLIGDAAHAMGPVWAQGAGLALEDGLVLAELLAQQADWETLGAEFERIRRPRVEHVQAATDRMSRLARLPSWLRDLAGPRLGPGAYRAAYGPLRTPVDGASPR